MISVAPGATPDVSGRIKVLMISSEVAPFAQTGGLGDVVSGLSLCLARLGCDVLIVTPRYGVSRAPQPARWWPETVTVRLGWGALDVVSLGVLEARVDAGEGAAVRICFLDHPNLFGREGIYGDAHGGFGDNDVRFTAMSRGALAVAERLWPSREGDDRTSGPDIVHAHDWHAALAVVDLALSRLEESARPRTVLTIHNLAFQGVYGAEVLDRIALPRAAFDDGTLAHDGQVNLLRGAIALADRVTTVSPTYAREILGRREGCGLDAVLREQRHKLAGILNGIDQSIYDPSTDASLARRYDRSSALDGRAACKAELVTETGLQAEGGPIFASVCRLAEQKGIDLLLSIVPALVERGASFILMGAGDASLEHALRAMAARFPGRVEARIAFDPTVARRIYAGADFFVVPSRYEPCGLTQLYAMRYGAIPVVTAVGGLKDTVTPISAAHEAGTGFVAANASVVELLVACEDAIALYHDRVSHEAAVVRAMSRESGWSSSAGQYLALYHSALS